MPDHTDTTDPNRFALGLYAHEVVRQCRIGLLAAEQLEHEVQWLQNALDMEAPAAAMTAELRVTWGTDPSALPRWLLGQPKYELRIMRVWAAAQALLVASALVSRLLWPTVPKDRALRALTIRRGRALRKALMVVHDSPLRSKELRDHIEHFDERLDEWVAAWVAGERSGHFMDDMFFVTTAAAPSDPPENEMPWTIFRSLDGTQLIFGFKERPFQLRGLIAALRDLLPRSQAMTSK